jgi:plastocyanin
MKGTNMTLQRRDAIKSLISIGLTVATSTAAYGKTIEISMTDSAFVPPTITINAGDEVTWKNPALLLHTITFDSAQAADNPISNCQPAFSHSALPTYLKTACLRTCSPKKGHTLTFANIMSRWA